MKSSIFKTSIIGLLVLPVVVMASETADQGMKERLCTRVVNRFSDDEPMWERVNNRIEKRFGFRCEHMLSPESINQTMDRSATQTIPAEKQRNTRAETLMKLYGGPSNAAKASSCSESDYCSDWSECQSGLQYRVCSAPLVCNITNNQQRSCSSFIMNGKTAGEEWSDRKLIFDEMYEKAAGANLCSSSYNRIVPIINRYKMRLDEFGKQLDEGTSQHDSILRSLTDIEREYRVAPLAFCNGTR